MNFVAIDFETANSNRTSPCSLGIIEIKDGNIINEKYYLIDPEERFDTFNIYLHGITPDIIEGKPNFKILWPEIKRYFENKFVIAHNAAFDISVLRRTLDKYFIEYPNFRYSCTEILSKKTWNNLINYKLDTIAGLLEIKFKHHNAAEDAKTAAFIMKEIFKINNTVDFDDLHEALKVKIGCVYPGGYKPAKVIHQSRIDISSIVPETNQFDENGALYNKNVVFTGTLMSMLRREAMQKVINAGGKCGDGITKETNYLVMGIQDYSKLTDGEKSSKLKKAEKLISEGQDLEIIAEADFLNMF